MVNLHVYHYAGNNPVKYTDPDGKIAETVWDIASLATGIASLIVNIEKGNARGIAVDALGIIADAVAVAVPVLPGGAGMAIKAARVASAVADIAAASEGIVSTVEAIQEGKPVEAIKSAGGVVAIGLTRGAGKSFETAAGFSKNFATKAEDVANIMSIGAAAIDASIVTHNAIELAKPPAKLNE
jgi:hypothetical protein